MHFTSRTFKLWWEPPKQKRSVILLTRCRTRKYEHFITHIVSPSRTKAYYYNKQYQKWKELVLKCSIRIPWEILQASSEKFRSTLSAPFQIMIAVKCDKYCRFKDLRVGNSTLVDRFYFYVMGFVFVFLLHHSGWCLVSHQKTWSSG